MSPKRMSRMATLLVPLMTTALLGCDDSPSEPATTLLDEVRTETGRFSSAAVATAAGYVADEHCVAHPDLGGMGQHWVNEDQVDPIFDPLRPEALLYEPQPGGGVGLVGVEYIVIDTGQTPPDFDGQPFDEGGVPPLTEAGVSHWSLHVWVHEENPNGTFTPFNPRVTCG